MLFSKEQDCVGDKGFGGEYKHHVHARNSGLNAASLASQPSMYYKFYHLSIDFPEPERGQLKEYMISFLFPCRCLRLLFPLVKSDFYFFLVNTPRALQPAFCLNVT